MDKTKPKKSKILFLFSDTGGGHRSATEAIIEAIDLEYPGMVETEMVDFFKEYAPPPFDMALEIYPPLSRLPDVWALGYYLSDGQRRTRAFTHIVWPYVRRAVYRLVREHPSDLIVSVHPVSNAVMLRGLKKNPVPFVTVITDLVSTHSLWYDRAADLVIVATQTAMQRGLEHKLKPEQMQVIGLPVADRFCHPLAQSKSELRQYLNWPQDKLTALLVGGGDGMGPLEQTAMAINQAKLDINLVIVTGRNQKLRERLESYSWNQPTSVYGFVREMPSFMRAADVLITKAGPGTINEAFIAELPIILYNRMPGQEEGNVDYVVTENAGVWAPQPQQVAATLANWLENPEERQRVAQASKSLANPDAARQIAHSLIRILAPTIQQPATISI